MKNTFSVTSEGISTMNGIESHGNYPFEISTDGYYFVPKGERFNEDKYVKISFEEFKEMRAIKQAFFDDLHSRYKTEFDSEETFYKGVKGRFYLRVATFSFVSNERAENSPLPKHIFNISEKEFAENCKVKIKYCDGSNYSELVLSGKYVE